MNPVRLLLIACLALGACAKNPVTGDQDFALMSEAEEIQQGRDYHSEILRNYGRYDDDELQDYVNRVGQKLAAASHRAHLEYHFTVLDTPEINAFALPGGYIYVTRGIMAYLDSEAELAGVLGHEIGHVTARHSVRQQAGQFATGILSVLISATTGESALGSLSQQLSTGLIRGYGRDHELEADQLGAEYLHACGYDPENMLEVIGVLKDQEVYERALAEKENRPPNIYHGVYATHPENDERLQTVVRAARQLSSERYRDDNRDEYHRHIDGMIWGSSLEQGVVANNRLAHPELAIAMDLPAGWKVDNNPRFLEARDPASTALLQVGVTARNKKESPAAALKRLTGDDDLETMDTDYGATAISRVRIRGAGQDARIAAVVLDDKTLLTLLGTADAEDFSEADTRLLAAYASFEHLDAAQVAAIRAPRLRVIEAESSSFDALAADSALDYDAENILRLLNRSFPAGRISQLDRVKTVTLDD